MAAKTHIQSVRNDRSTPIEYQNLENPGCNKAIPGGGTTRNIGCDIPWAYNAEEFLKKRLEIQDGSTGQLIAQIWSREVSGDGDFVRVSTTGFSEPGARIPGSNPIAGSPKRLLVVLETGVRLDDLE